jgi:large-conductance mechanosensitive channel
VAKNSWYAVSLINNVIDFLCVFTFIFTFIVSLLISYKEERQKKERDENMGKMLAKIRANSLLLKKNLLELNFRRDITNF